VKHSHDFDNDFLDPAGWNRASYTPDLLAEIGEPLPEASNDRGVAIYFLGIMFAADEFIMAASDARFAVIVVAVTLQWPSVRDLSVSNIADQLGCSPATITRSMTKIREMSGLAGGVRFIWPDAESLNGDKPAAVQSIGNIPREPGPIAW
jgi:hypothetical protein